VRKLLKWIGIVIGGLVGAVVLAVVVLTLTTNARLKQVYDVKPKAVAIPADEASLKEGARLASIYCSGCHGPDFGGTDFFNEPPLAVVDATNLTRGSGGIGSSYTEEDWIRAIRHGVDPEGRPLFIMPSKDFNHFNDGDLGQLVAYLQSVPPVDRESTPFNPGPVGKILIALGIFGDVLNAETIAHDERPPAPSPGVSVQYGQYLVNTFGCQTCHGENLGGGTGPEPGAPPGPDLTANGNLGKISDEDFILLVRVARSEYMPYESLAKMSDDELRAIWSYLQSLPE
jgi:mono/diheme cytochrome c family protein